jgi:TonB family protein
LQSNPSPSTLDLLQTVLAYNQAMHSVRTFVCAFVFLVLPLRSQAQNVHWFEIKSGNFILFTDTSESKGRRLVTDLEQRIATFQTVFGAVPKRQFPVEILLFKQNEDFLSSAPPVVPPEVGVDSYTSAFILKGSDRIFIVAQDKSPDDIANDIGHALGHILLDRIVLWHPFWLEEAAGEYFRKVARNPENKRILPADQFSVGDILTIVPSATYKDSDPAGPFRIQSYRLLRIAVDEYNAELRSYVNALKQESGRDAKLAIDESAATNRLGLFSDTRIPAATSVPDIQTREVPLATVSIHRGDELAAAHQNLQSSKWYEGDTDDARAARAILGRIISGNEAIPLMERAVMDFPDHGLVQYHFGTLDSQDPNVLTQQIDALERAVRLLPLMGRADAELARVLTRSFRAEEALPLLDKSVSLEPEYADRFYLIRAEALMVLRRFDEAFKTAKTAAALPHADRATAVSFDKQVALVDKRIQDIATEVERLQVNDLQESVAAEAARREPPRPPPPPPQPIRAGQIEYQYEATNPVEILKPVLPEYPDELVKSGKAGRITLQVNIGVDGHVVNATITDSQLPDMNAATVAAAKKWTFKPLLRAGQPVTFNIRLSFQYSIQ